MNIRAWVAEPRFPATFSALQYPNYRKWFGGQTISLMGTWMQWVAQGWLVYNLTGSKLALGAISFAGTLPTLFLMLPAGVLADRVSKRRLLMVTQSAMMLLAFTLAVLVASGRLEIWMIAVIAVLTGITNSFDAPARLSLAVELVDDRRDLQNAIALNATMFNMARYRWAGVGRHCAGLAGGRLVFRVERSEFPRRIGCSGRHASVRGREVAQLRTYGDAAT